MDSDANINKLIIDANINRDINNIISKLSYHSDYYLNTNNIYNEIYLTIINSLKSNSHEIKNRCLICNQDIGRDNPRQLCGKIRCINE